MYQVEVYLRVKGDRMSGQWGVNGQHKRPVELVSINVIFPPMENVTLNPKEQARLKVLNSLLAEQMTVDQAAGLMGVSTRHTRRMLAAYRKEGVAALAHGHRGRRPPNATPETTRAEVLHLASTRYFGTNHTHLSELLGEREGIDIDRSTLRRILVSAGLNSPRRRRPPQHRVRRQRMPQEGMLIQMDGSYHRWLGEGGPQFTLLLAVDDATGAVVNAHFCERENARNYFLVMQELVQSYGAPVALYVDRHAVFKHTPGSGLAGAPTQFSRAMDELGIQMIFALSPQAKGRVERTAETFQDRLVTELRLAGAATIAEADGVLQGFLPRFNTRFAVPPQSPEAAYRPLALDVYLDRILCFKHSRKVAWDNTVKFQLHTLQLLPEPKRPSYACTVVEVLEGLDGRLSLQHQGRIIPSQEAPPNPVFMRTGNGSSPPVARRRSGPDHPARPWATALSQLDTHCAEGTEHDLVANRGTAAGKVAAIPPRKPTFLQKARWKAIQKEKRKGMSIRGIARELGIHRATVRRYLDADNPPARQSRIASTTPISDTIAA